MNGFNKVLLWELKTPPNPQEVVVDVAEDIRLPTCVSAKSLQLIRTGGEGGNGVGATLSIPVTGLPLQEFEDPPHLFSKKRDFFLPAVPACTSL